MSPRTRILLVDDHSLMRAGLRALLEATDAVEIVAEAKDGEQALLLAQQYQPDLVLMDISMEGVNGIEATGRIRRELPGVRVVILSMHVTADHITHALRAGASGYVIKDSATSELEDAIAAVIRGEIYLSPTACARLLDGQAHSIRSTKEAGSGLTPRQREILQLLAQGRTTKQIAYQLALSTKTVETHRAKLMERLDIYDVPGLVRYAMRIGLVGLD